MNLSIHIHAQRTPLSHSVLSSSNSPHSPNSFSAISSVHMPCLERECEREFVSKPAWWGWWEELLHVVSCQYFAQVYSAGKWWDSPPPSHPNYTRPSHTDGVSQMCVNGARGSRPRGGCGWDEHREAEVIRSGPKRVCNLTKHHLRFARPPPTTHPHHPFPRLGNHLVSRILPGVGAIESTTFFLVNWGGRREPRCVWRCDRCDTVSPVVCVRYPTRAVGPTLCWWIGVGGCGGVGTSVGESAHVSFVGG